MSKPQLQQVVIGYDCSDHAQPAVDHAIGLACSVPSNVLHFLVVIDPRVGATTLPPEGKVDYLYAEKVQEHVSKRIHGFFADREAPKEIHFFVHARIGDAAHEILDLAAEVGADLVVLGSHGHTGVKRLLLGSVSERVVREAGCPVLICRAKTYPQVELDTIISVPHQASHYAPPHRYSYSDTRVTMRPRDWPLF